MSLRKAGRRKPGFVYFLKCPSNDLIKIGWTSGDPAVRLLKIRATSPVVVEPMAMTPGTRDDEREYHLRFEHLRDHCEWFRPDRDLLYAVARAQPWTDAPALSRRKIVAIPVYKPQLSDWAFGTTLTVRGVSRTVAEWCELTGLDPFTIKMRISMKHPIDDIFHFEGPDAMYLHRSNPGAPASRGKYDRWRAGLSEREWESYAGWHHRMVHEYEGAGW